MGVSYLMKLTNRELAVMKILWEADEPLMVSEIVQRDPNSTIYSVQRIIQNLMKKNIVAVDSIAYNKKSLARKFKPLISAESVELTLLQDMFNNMVSKDIMASHLIAALLPTENTERTLEELNALEQIIAERKQQLLEAGATDTAQKKK